MGLMSAQGARSDQLVVVSYGEERPVCRVSDEECWAQNRRVEIVYTSR
jgi:peptidoglycan-associated lipoprotein